MDGQLAVRDVPGVSVPDAEGRDEVSPYDELGRDDAQWMTEEDHELTCVWHFATKQNRLLPAETELSALPYSQETSK